MQDTIFDELNSLFYDIRSICELKGRHLQLDFLTGDGHQYTYEEDKLFLNFKIDGNKTRAQVECWVKSPGGKEEIVFKYCVHLCVESDRINEVEKAKSFYCRGKWENYFTKKILNLIGDGYSQFRSDVPPKIDAVFENS